MDSSRLNDWFQVAAAVGVILSLIFVGLEIQQSREIAIADIYQQRAALAIQVQQSTILVEKYSTAIDKLLSGEALDRREANILKWSQNPWFQYWENNHFQYEIGLLSEAAWQPSRNALRDRLRMPIYQEWWEMNRSYWRDSFAQEVDEILKEIRASQQD